MLHLIFVLLKYLQCIFQESSEFVDDATLIPFCKFAQPYGDLQKCQLFKESMVTLQREQCFTFNRDGTHFANMTSNGPDGGLSFLLNYWFLYDKDEYKRKPMKIFFHQPHTYPDTLSLKFNPIYIYPGYQVSLRIVPSKYDYTQDFSTLSEEKRHCSLKEDNIQCATKKVLKYAENRCDCIPWYVKNSSRMCDTFGNFCFEDIIKNLTKTTHLEEACLSSCKFFKYSAILVGQRSSANVIDEAGTEVKDYIQKDFKAVVMARLERNSFDTRLSTTSFVDINFEEPEMIVYAKNAKMTLSDKIGSIGGTFGLFLGFSCLGMILDFLKFAKDFIESILKSKMF